MIDESREDEAIRYVLGQMGGPEAAAFRLELDRKAELRNYVRDLEPVAASLALAGPAVAPPPAVLIRILTELQPSAPPTRAELRAPSSGWDESNRWEFRQLIPWALAACLAIACTSLGFNHVRLKNELAKVRQREGHTQQELAAVRQHDELAQVRIATLSAQVQTYAKVAAVVVWNAEKQRGLVSFTTLPALDRQHDYQLWVIDPSQPKPVSAGVVAVGTDGAARAEFQPVSATPTAAQFALSIERKGGETAPQGQIVLAGK